MRRQPTARYQVNAQWQIVEADTEFCRLFRGSRAALIGRDVRELLRQDWRLDFRRYVARALVGVGEPEAMVPMLAPCGQEVWCRHHLEAVIQDGFLAGFTATIVLRLSTVSTGPKRWWQWRGHAPHIVWDAELEPLARAS